MNPEMAYGELMTRRGNFYQFLSRFFRREMDDKQVARLKQMVFPTACEDALMEEGYRLLENYLQAADEGAPLELAVDYARIFLGAGRGDTNAAYPYESFYVSGQRNLMQEARDQVLASYLKKGLQKNPETASFPEDHLALELYFMAVLCEEGAGLTAGDQPAAVLESLQEQRQFLQEHLLNWIPGFCRDIDGYAATDFYRGIGRITSGFLKMDGAVLIGLLEKQMSQANKEV